ncbi:MAG: hypothetical protein FJ096_04520 [Deltaproteobacteria bacterium]|nr:hypothetical protein [Deltaproteobacteria bacterium]
MNPRVLAHGFAAVALALAGTGCGVHHDDDEDRRGGERFYATIDADEVMTTNLGDGAALFVEYRRGGTWRFWTSCDTRTTGYPCKFYLKVYPYGGIGAVSEQELEDNDDVDIDDDGVLVFDGQTALDSDAIELVSKPKALLELALDLDGAAAPSYLAWVGNGTVYQGAPRLPVVLQPDAP